VPRSLTKENIKSVTVDQSDPPYLTCLVKGKILHQGWQEVQIPEQLQFKKLNSNNNFKTLTKIQ
jgi:hypothetical protein